MNSEEIAFLRAILAAPGDLALRRVYSDWLEEQGGQQALARAEYLRVECELDSLPARDTRQHRRLTDRLRGLREAVGDDWWRALDYAAVEHCVQFTYRCPQRWDTLEPTEDPSVRHCTECQRPVHYCRTVREAHERADAGECVAIDSRPTRVSFGAVRQAQASGRRLLGRVMPTVPRRVPLAQRGHPAE